MSLSGPLFGKRLQLLKEAVPLISQVAVLWDTTMGGSVPTESWDSDAQAIGVRLRSMGLRGPEEIDTAFEDAVRGGVDALIRGPGPLINAQRARIIQLAAQLRWPAMWDQRRFVDEGGLMAYEASAAETWRRAATYVDKILKGAQPAEIPIEQPMRFDFVVNLKTAQALGITFPNEILLQVTEVVQ
jgi:putative tryptophan/tyrosine transport system substrate-binding protein